MNTNVLEAIKGRRSIRAYDPRPVEAEKIQQILEAANRAPSAGNLQAYEIYVLIKAAKRADLARAVSNQDCLAAAPAILAFCTHAARSEWRYGEKAERLFALQDATIACAFAMLAATALDLGSVWVGAFDEDAVRRALGAPSGHRPVAILPLGYPAEQPLFSSRRELGDIVHRL